VTSRKYFASKNIAELQRQQQQQQQQQATRWRHI